MCMFGHHPVYYEFLCCGSATGVAACVPTVSALWQRARFTSQARSVFALGEVKRTYCSEQQARSAHKRVG